MSVAARMAGLALAGQAITTGDTVAMLSPQMRDCTRRHAKIELRGGKFVLIDQSANGTFVTLGGDGEIKLRREELILHGSGIICFGHSASNPGAETVRFTVAPSS